VVLLGSISMKIICFILPFEDFTIYLQKK